MKNMRYKGLTIIFITICSILLFPSCDNYLVTSSKSTFTEQTVFENIDYADKALYGVYDVMTDNNMWMYSLMFTMLDTDVEVNHYGVDNGLSALGHYKGNPSNTAVGPIWTRLYRMIDRANLIIDNLPNGPLWNGAKQKEARKIYGEAIVLRAYAYYLLTGLWGDVPFPITSTKAGSNFYLPKTSRDEIYPYLIQDLADVQEYLPWSSEAGTVKRVSKGVAKGLRARLALMQAGYGLRGESENYITRRGKDYKKYYQIARDECYEMMNSGMHQLKPDFESIWKDLHKYSEDISYGEIFWEVPFGRSVNGRVAQSIGIKFQTNPADPTYGRAEGEIKLAVQYYYTFDKLDKRRDISAMLSGYSTTSKCFVPIHAIGREFCPSKFRRNWIVPNMGGAEKDVMNTGVGFPLMRYTDIVLMFAEAENEINGPTDLAKKALASVRQRAFSQENLQKKVIDYVDSVSADHNTFFKAIVNERAWEFGGELYRKFDLIRWNLLADKKDEMRAIIDNIFLTPNVPPYNWVPQMMFWRTASDGETIEILNPDYRIDRDYIPGYTAIPWLSGRPEGEISSGYTFFNQVMDGYRRNLNNYIYPIPQSVIDASNGTLKNDIWRP